VNERPILDHFAESTVGTLSSAGRALALCRFIPNRLRLTFLK
jgi:hypothetical protein